MALGRSVSLISHSHLGYLVICEFYLGLTSIDYQLIGYTGYQSDVHGGTIGGILVFGMPSPYSPHISGLHVSQSIKSINQVGCWVSVAPASWQHLTSGLQSGGSDVGSNESQLSFTKLRSRPPGGSSQMECAYCCFAALPRAAICVHGALPQFAKQKQCHRALMASS